MTGGDRAALDDGIAVQGDRAMLRSAGRRLGLLSAGLVALVVCVLTSATAWIVLDAQDDAAAGLLSSTVVRADDVGDPPAGVWLTLVQGSRQQSTRGSPAVLPDRAALAATVATGATEHSTVRSPSATFQVLTVRRADGTVAQAALDLQANHDERMRLVVALLVGGGLGLLGAAGVGVLLGRRAVRPLADAVRLQRTFVADASHELRTPLTLLHTRAQLLERGLAATSPSSQAHRDAEGVVHDTRRLADLIDDLLLAADARAGSEPVDLGVLVTETVASARDFAAAERVRLEEGSNPGPVGVLASDAGLRRALLALVDNAIRHSPAGGSVRVGAASDGRTASITVGDDGPGFAPDDVGRLTRRFASGEQTAGRRTYGLGLALASEVATRYGGRLQISARPQPSSVSLVLPVAPAGRFAR